jgi:hypothetical protein
MWEATLTTQHRGEHLAGPRPFSSHLRKNTIPRNLAERTKTMRTTVTSTAILVLLCGIVAPPAHAQKGMGEQTGVGRQAVRPEVVSLSGKVLATETGPCEKTTGPADVGSHFLLVTPKGKKLNIHLGPAAVDYIVEQLTVGKKVTVHAFRTAKMPHNHYVAQALTLDGTTIRLRDEGLRPFWALGGRASSGRGGPPYGPGMRQGPPWRNGFGYGPGQGRGWGRGGGHGWGRR